MIDRGVEMVFAGDFCASNGLSFDFDEASLGKLIKKQTLAWINLEGPLVGKNRVAMAKAGPNICQGKEVLRALDKIGFNAFCLANNHIMDFGTKGLKETLAALDKRLSIGAAEKESDAYKCLIQDVGGVRVGFMSVAEWGFGAADGSAGFAWIGHQMVNRVIFETKKKVDFLVLQVHAGVEEIKLPLPEWRKKYRELIDMGVDLIVGHHPHVPQGYETYKGKEIYYSLGNFYFEIDGKVPDTNGIILSISLKRINKKLSVKSNVYSLIKENRTLALGKEMKRTLVDYATINNKTYLASIDKVCLDLWEKSYKRFYYEAIERQFSLRYWLYNCLWGKWSRNSMINTLMLLHNLKIESHLWLTQRALRLINLKKYGN